MKSLLRYTKACLITAGDVIFEGDRCVLGGNHPDTVVYVVEQILPNRIVWSSYVRGEQAATSKSDPDVSGWKKCDLRVRN